MIKNIKFILIVFLLTGCATKKTVVETWPDGKPGKVVEKIDQSRTVEYSYYPNGQLEYEVHYFNQMLDGPTRYWDDKGNLISEANYLGGKLHGIWRHYTPSGVLIHYEEYFHGKKHGVEKWYWTNGQLKSEMKWEYGEPAGQMKRWDVYGKPLN